LCGIVNATFKVHDKTIIRHSERSEESLLNCLPERKRDSSLRSNDEFGEAFLFSAFRYALYGERTSGFLPVAPGIYYANTQAPSSP